MNKKPRECHYPVLVVDDSAVTREILLRILTANGFDAVAASDAFEALRILKKRIFPIVITDSVMPGMDGPELCQEIRANISSDRYVYVMFLSSNCSSRDYITGFEAGADDYLDKPIEPEELLVRLKVATRILDLERSLRNANDRIRRLAQRDALTGVYNRRYLLESITGEIDRAFRYGRPLSLILYDIDHFKTVNDTYGHQAGDAVLKGILDRLGRTLRQGIDWISRYGGEEFLVVLPETDPDDAVGVAERMRETIAEAPFVSGDEEIAVTASFGVTGIRPGPGAACPDFDGLMKVADQCLYSSKQNGRNRVTGRSIGLTLDPEHRAVDAAADSEHRQPVPC